MSVEGARSLRINEAGALVVGTGLGEVTFTPPVAFQERQGARRLVKAAYELYGRRYGFRLGDHDPAVPVEIDPLLQATYLGGSGTDEALALAIHPTSGDVYVAGDTGSTNFPGTTGGAQAANGGGLDAFVARLTVGLVAVEPTPTDTPTSTPTNTPTSTPTNTPALPVNIPTTSEGGLLAFGLLLAALGYLLLRSLSSGGSS